MVDWAETRESLLGESEATLLPDVKLPVLPQAVSEFAQKADDPDCSIRQLSAIVETDSGLTFQLLKNVNSSANGLKHRIASVQHAISSLGIRRTKLCLMSAAIQNAMPAGKLRMINLAAFWNTNLERAFFAKRLAELLKTDADLAFAAALLQDFLLPILTNELEEKYLDFTREQESNPVDLVRFEQSTFGWNHAEAAGRVMSDWGFPDDLVCCVMFHHHGLGILAEKDFRQTPAAAVSLAGLMPDMLRQMPVGLDHLIKLHDIWKVFDLNQIAEEVFVQYEQQALDAANYIPFKEHCRCHEVLTATTEV